MSTARMSLGALFGAVATAANTVTSTLNMANDGVGMLNKVVSDAAKKQEIDSKIEMNMYLERTIRIKTMEEVHHKKEVLKFCNESAENHQLYEAGYNRLHALFAETK